MEKLPYIIYPTVEILDDIERILKHPDKFRDFSEAIVFPCRFVQYGIHERLVDERQCSNFISRMYLIHKITAPLVPDMEKRKAIETRDVVKRWHELVPKALEHFDVVEIANINTDKDNIPFKIVTECLIMNLIPRYDHNLATLQPFCPPTLCLSLRLCDEMVRQSFVINERTEMLKVNFYMGENKYSSLKSVVKDRFPFVLPSDLSIRQLQVYCQNSNIHDVLQACREIVIGPAFEHLSILRDRFDERDADRVCDWFSWMQSFSLRYPIDSIDVNTMKVDNMKLKPSVHKEGPYTLIWWKMII